MNSESANGWGQAWDQPYILRPIGLSFRGAAVGPFSVDLPERSLISDASDVMLAGAAGAVCNNEKKKKQYYDQSSRVY